MRLGSAGFSGKTGTARPDKTRLMEPAMQNRPFSTQKEKPMPINWRRGIFRLWILASAAWIMGWLIYFAIELISGESTAGQLVGAPVVLLGPPVALLLFGVATRWAFRGFQVDDGFPGV